MFCDAEKEFDRVEWGFLEEVLTRMEFRPNFRKWVRLICSKQAAEIFFEESKFKIFRLHGGVRIRCSLLPLMFDLVIELLATLVHQRNDIKGIENLGRSHKLLLYADDVIFTLQDPVTLLL